MTRFKYRLIGGVILVALLLLILPFLYTGNGLRQSIPDLARTIPVSPLSMKETANQPISDQGSKAATQTDSDLDANADKSDEPASQIPEEPPLHATTTNDDSQNSDGTRWTIQLGTFANEDHALSLERKMQELGYWTILKTHKNKKGTVFYQVFAGPIDGKTKAEELQTRLVDQFKLHGLLKRYNP